MREAQKAHFRTKSSADLEKAKALEKEVDGLIKAYQERIDAMRQPRLI